MPCRPLNAILGTETSPCTLCSFHLKTNSLQRIHHTLPGLHKKTYISCFSDFHRFSILSFQSQLSCVERSFELQSRWPVFALFSPTHHCQCTPGLFLLSLFVCFLLLCLLPDLSTLHPLNLPFSSPSFFP